MKWRNGPLAIHSQINGLELHGTKGILKLNNVWSFNSKVEYVGDGGNDKIAGTTFELMPFFTPPFNHKNV